MDMKQLTTFMTLAKTLNYQKAADQLQYAPSTLFKHIQLLEQELGVELFVKAGRQLRLTDEGERFVAHAQDILDLYRRALRSISGCGEEERSLNIGGCEINIANSLLDLFAQFSAGHPDARMSMHTGPNAGVPGMVKSDIVDLGFYYSLTGSGIQDLCTQKMYQEQVFLMADKEHPLAGRQGIRYEDLQGMRFVYPHDSCCFVVEHKIDMRFLIAGDTLHGGYSPLIGSDEKVWRVSLEKLLGEHFDAFTFGHCNPQVICDADERIRSLVQSFANYYNPWFKDFYRSYPY